MVTTVGTSLGNLKSIRLEPLPAQCRTPSDVSRGGNRNLLSAPSSLSQSASSRKSQIRRPSLRQHGPGRTESFNCPFRVAAAAAEQDHWDASPSSSPSSSSSSSSSSVGTPNGHIVDVAAAELEKRAEQLLEAEFNRASTGVLLDNNNSYDNSENNSDSNSDNNSSSSNNGHLVMRSEQANAQSVKDAEASAPASASASLKKEGDSPAADPGKALNEGSSGSGEEKASGVPAGSDVPAGSAVLGSSSGSRGSSFRWAQTLMSNLASRVNDLETGLKHREQDMEESNKYMSIIKERSETQNQTSRLRQAEEVARRMQLQLKDIERTVATKDDMLNKLLQKTAMSEKKLESLEKQSSSDKERLQSELQTERSRSRVELDSVIKREEGLMQRLQEAQDGIAERDVFLKQLQEEAALSASALKQAAQAMVAARDRTLRIEEQLEMLGDELVKEKDNTAKERQKSAQLTADLTEARIGIEDLNVRVKELEVENSAKDQELLLTNARLAQSAHEISATAETLSEAEHRIRELEALVEEQKEELKREAEASSLALESAPEKEKRIQESEEKAKKLADEVAALKASLENKDRAVEAVREETHKNAELLMSAARTRKELAEAKRKVEQLENQKSVLRREVEEKEQFLKEIRSEAKGSAEALRTATLIKQELNEAKEREGQLLDDLEAKEMELQQLRMEVEENTRAQRAELALQEVGRRAAQLESERSALRAGIMKRDQALVLMKQELERGANMLSAAAETREALHVMKSQMDSLQQEAQSKNQRLDALEDEIVGVGNSGFPASWFHTKPKRTKSKSSRGSAPSERPSSGSS